jgi:hypothetical protein
MTDREEGGSKLLMVFFFSFSFRLSLELVDSCSFLKFFRSHWWSCLAIFFFLSFFFRSASKSVLFSPRLHDQYRHRQRQLHYSFFPVALGFLVMFPTSYYPCPCPRLRLRSNDFLLLLLIFFSFLFHPCYSINCCRNYIFPRLHFVSFISSTSSHCYDDPHTHTNGFFWYVLTIS